MAPPEINLPDDVLAQIVRSHFEKKMQGGVKAHVKRHGVSYAKLLAAMGALTAAINGYTELSRGNMELSKENRLLFRALAGKVNSVAEKVAYIEGRIDGMGKTAAKKAAEEMVTPLTHKHASRGSFNLRGRSPDILPALAAKPEKEKPKEAPAVASKHEFEVKAYDQLPEKLDQLIQLEQTAQQAPQP